MSQTVFGAPAVVSILNRAFTNTSPGNLFFQNQVNVAGATRESQVQFAAQFGNNFASLVNDSEALTETIVTNMGLTGVETEFLTALKAEVVALFESVPASVRGVVVLILSEVLSSVEGATGDLALMSPVAAAWNNEIAQAYQYSVNPANVDPSTGETPAGQAFALTNNTDVATANVFNANQVYTPGGDQRINSLQDEDQLTGTGTNPTLNATLGNANDNGATIITPELNGIETVNAAFTGSGGFAVTDLDLQDATGVNTVNITRVSQASNVARVENIQQVVANLGLSNTNANQGGAVEFSFGAGVLAGESAATLNVENVQIGAVNVGQNTSGVAAFGVAGQGYENLTLHSAGSANTIGVLNLPMDTGTNGKLAITGDKNLTLATTANVVNGATGTIESINYAGGVAAANGRLAAIDASAFTGNLTLNIAAGQLTAGKADTSGVLQNVAITGGAGNDKFILADTVEAGDSITGGAGTDTLVLVRGADVTATSSVITAVENIEVRAANGGAVAVDFNKLPDAQQILVRNEGAVAVAGAVVPSAQALVTTLNNLNATQAANIQTQHSNTGSNGIAQNTIVANVTGALAGTADLVGLNIGEGLNTNPRFNVVLNAANVESVTLTDADTESNTVALGNVAHHTGTIKLAGGLAGTFLNLDTTTTGGNGGIYQYDVTGAAAGDVANRIADQSGNATQVRLQAATIDASAEVSNVVLRVSSTPTAVSAVGAQSILLGSGNDTVVFDNLNDTRAGLSISDTVTGGEGNDTLAIDGNVRVTLGASEWTNVSGFETIRVVGNGQAANNAVNATNSYNLTLTNNLLAANKDANGVLNILADNDSTNNAGVTLAVAPADAALSSGGVTIDARSLAAGSKWSFKGNEGAGRSADRIILSDANIDGNAIIDGGAVDNISDNAALVNGVMIGNYGNADILEIRNAAVVSQGDLAQAKNIGTLSFTNDQAVTQVSTLQLNDSIVDNLVDSFQASAARAVAGVTGTNVEVLRVSAVDNVNLLAATTGLIVDASQLTSKSDLDIVLGRGKNEIFTGAGQDSVVLLGNYATGTYAGILENEVSVDAQATNVVAARVVTDTINLGAGIDTLTTYGAINLAGATLTGVEVLVANSDVTLTQEQYNALSAISFTGSTNHTLTILDSVGGAAIDLGKVVDQTTGNITITNNAAEGQTGVVANGTDANATGTNSATGVPSYSLTASATSVDEGASVTFNLSTTNVPVGPIAYTLSGISAADVVGGVLTGNATVGADGKASVTVALAADATTEGVETLTMTVAGKAASVTVNDTSLTPVGTPLVAGTTAPVAATALADTFTFNVAAAKALADNTVISVTGFAVAADKLVIDTATASPAVTTLAGLAGIDGIVVQTNVITNDTLITFGADANGDLIAITLAGVTDPALVNISVI